MTTPDPKLSEMINDAPVQEAAAEQQIEQLDESIEDLQEKRDSMADNICGKTEDDLRTYLQGSKLAEIQALYPANPPVPPILPLNLPPYYGDVYVVFGGTYGSINYTTGNITDWQFLQDTILPTPPDTLVRYVYTPPPGPGDDPVIDDNQADFDFANDYITRPLDSGASYGLDGLIAAYGTGKSITAENKAKVEASSDVLKRYL